MNIQFPSSRDGSRTKGWNPLYVPMDVYIGTTFSIHVCPDMQRPEGEV